MKKQTALLLALLLLCALAGCGGGAAQPTTQETAGDAAEAASAEPCVVENETCGVTVTAEEETDGYRFRVSMENRSDSLLTFIVDFVGANGYDLYNETFGVFEAAEAGQTTETDFTVDKAALAQYDLAALSTATLSVVAVDESGAAVLEEFAVCTLREDAGDAARMPLEHEQTVLEQDGLRVTIGGGHVDDYGDYAVMLYVENDGAEAQLSLDQFRYNGHEADDFLIFSVPAGGKGYGQLLISANVLSLMELTTDDLSELSFTIHMEQPGADTAPTEQSVTYALQ